MGFCASLRHVGLGLRMPQETELVIAAPTPYLAHLTYHFPQISFAAQNVSLHENYGAYTGETSALMLDSCGVKYCIVGHQERRRDSGETDYIVKLKADNCIRAGITPIMCLGDDLSLRPSIDGKFMLAFEPKGSIGTGVLPTSEELDCVFGALKNQVAKSVNLVYGGSVNASNLAVIKGASNVDSILIGGAALQVHELVKILEDW